MNDEVLSDIFFYVGYFLLYLEFLFLFSDRDEDQVGYEIFAGAMEPEDDCDVIEIELFDSPPLNTYLVEPPGTEIRYDVMT